MTKPNPAEKLAEEIIERLWRDTGVDWRHKRVESIKGQLQPTFDLLKRIHKLSEMNTKLPAITTPHSVLEAIEQLTREYDNLT